MATKSSSSRQYRLPSNKEGTNTDMPTPPDSLRSSPSSSYEDPLSAGIPSITTPASPSSYERLSPKFTEDDDDSISSSSDDEYDDGRDMARERRRRRHHLQHQSRRREDLPPIVTSNASSTSVNTYDSAFSDVEGDDLIDEDDDDFDDENQQDPRSQIHLLPPSSGDAIPAVLPPYRASIQDPSVRPSTPHAFGRLFPSLDRLSVRHDDLTPDGNMNLRVDTLIPGPVSGSGSYRSGHGHRRPASMGPVAVQLFHLRMHDLGRRDFSLRRYCRDSGREVCNSKRDYVEPSATSRPAIQRSVSSALRSVTTPFQQQDSNGSSLFHRRPSTGTDSTSSRASDASHWDNDSAKQSRHRRGSVSTEGSTAAAATASRASQLVPTETIKLEFSNYARVDVTRVGNKRYDFEWWGQKYSWRRVVDRNVEGAPVSLHLFRRDGKKGAPAVAHIVPDSRSPTQVDAEENAGGWIPPCHMWISDPSIVEAQTDIADVIISTGLISLVDDCIKQRWNISNLKAAAKRSPIVKASIDDFPNAKSSFDSASSTSRRIMHSIFNRGHSDHQSSHPQRFNRPVAAY